MASGGSITEMRFAQSEQFSQIRSHFSKHYEASCYIPGLCTEKKVLLDFVWTSGDAIKSLL